MITSSGGPLKELPEEYPEPISFTDAQLDLLFTVLKPFTQLERSAVLAALACWVGGKREVRDAELIRALRELGREHRVLDKQSSWYETLF